jgi:GT2 family glycosyltransferase
MRASVIIVSFNSKDYLSDCLPSLMPSICLEDEIIVVNNASTDNTSAWVKKNYHKVRLIDSPENLGYAGGNNLGARGSHGKYLVFINPDTTVKKDWLNPLLNALEKNNDVGLVTSKILQMEDPNLINTCGNDVHISGITLCRGIGQFSEIFKYQEDVGAVSGAAFAIRADLFGFLDGFDENFFMYMEDTDLSWRGQIAGYRCLYVPESIVFHDYKLNFGSKKIFYQERNRYLLFLKNLKWSTLFFLLPVLFIAELISWSFVLLRDRNNYRNKIDAYYWIFKNWAQIKEKRSRIETYRKKTDHFLLAKTSYYLDFSQTGKNLISKAAKWFFTPIFWILRTLILIIVK